MKFRFWIQRKETLGAQGERLAAEYLRKLGYRILERNLQVDDDEADLVALDPDARTIVIVEVKTRADDSNAPEAAIGSDKQRHLIRLAMKLQKRDRYRNAPFRFDAVAVILPKSGPSTIRHIPGAFSAR